MATKLSVRVLTPRQYQAWEAFRELAARLGEAPSVREMAARLKIEVATAHEHLAALAGKGYLDRSPKGFRLPGPPAVPVPVLGRVPAGSPQEPLPAPEGYVPWPASFGRKARDLFALRVRGDSMTGAGVEEDDLIVCARDLPAREGDVVVALAEGGATVKRLGRADGRLALLPANPRYKPLPVGEDTRVIGRVIGVLRSFL